MKSIDLFLTLGCLPIFNEGSIDWLNYDTDAGINSSNDNISWWIAEGVKRMKEIFENEISNTPANALHVIPFSGGCDSRCILGGLLENLPKSQLVTVTFGIPGSWDFEIPQMVARKFHIQMEPMNLLNEDWDIERLISTAARIERPVEIYEAYFNQKVHDCFGVNAIYWSGFMGGNLGGGILRKEPYVSKDKAIKSYLYFDPPTNFKDDSFKEEIMQKILDEFHWVDVAKTNLCYELQLDFGLRQKFYIQPVLFEKGFNIKVPFLYKNWVDFILKAPHKWLYHEFLYKRILLECYKELFMLPVKNSSGMRVNASQFESLIGRGIARIKPILFKKDPYASHPRTQYINFCESIRHKTKFQELIYSTIQDLKKRDILCSDDIDQWWKDHVIRRTDNTRILLFLSSLEIMMKAGKFYLGTEG